MDTVISILKLFGFHNIPHELKQVKMTNKILMLLLPISMLIICIYILYVFNLINIGTFICVLIFVNLIYKIIFHLVPKYYCPLEITNIEPGLLKNNSVRDFKILLSNPTHEIVLLKSIVVNWHYIHGDEASLETPREITTASPVRVELLVDVHDETQKTTNVPLYKPIEFPPKSGNIEIDLMLYLTLKGKVNWHPCSNWNLSFDVKLVDYKGRTISIIQERSWIDFNRWDAEYLPLWINMK